MQQPIYHSNRNAQKRNSSSIIRVIVVWTLVILIGVRSIFFTDKNPSDDSDTLSGSVLSGDASTHYIGEKILSSGVMTPVATFTTYTHEFVANNGDLFGLKSKDIDLYQYSGSIDLKWEITDFKKDVPVITVSEIVWTKQGTWLAEWLVEGNPDYYFFKDVGLGFDLSITQGYTVEQQADEILLIDLGKNNQPETVLTIAPFICQPWDNLKDCQALLATFATNGNEKYVSAQDITFYNLTETKTWIAFNKGYGYYVTPTEENTFSSFIDFMSFMSQERIQEAATKDIATMCKDINQTMSQVTSTEFDYQANGIVVVTMRWLDSEGHAVGCEVGVRLGNSLKVVPIRFLPTQGWALNDDNQQVIITPPTGTTAATGTTTPPKNDDKQPVATDTGKDEIIKNPADEQWMTPPAQQTPPESYSGRLSHQSVRGYTMYFSNKSISYAGQIIDKIDLGISGLSCTYQLNIVQWAHADQADTNPDVIVYECTWNPSASDLASKNLQKVGITKDLIFVAKYLTTNLGDIQIAVVGATE